LAECLDASVLGERIKSEKVQSDRRIDVEQKMEQNP